jgi:anti-anti-sigma factor
LHSHVRGPLLRVSVVRIDDAVVVRLDGELDISTAPLVGDALRAADEVAPLRRVVVDAERLAFADASGLEPLLAVHDRLGAGAVQVRNAGTAVRRLLQLLSLTEAFGVTS